MAAAEIVGEATIMFLRFTLCFHSFLYSSRQISASFDSYQADQAAFSINIGNAVP
jgi:hypothetical protein